MDYPSQIQLFHSLHASPCPAFSLHASRLTLHSVPQHYPFTLHDSRFTLSRIFPSRFTTHASRCLATPSLNSIHKILFDEVEYEDAGKEKKYGDCNAYEIFVDCGESG